MTRLATHTLASPAVSPTSLTCFQQRLDNSYLQKTSTSTAPKTTTFQLRQHR